MLGTAIVPNRELRL